MAAVDPFRTFVGLPDEVEYWSLTTLSEELVKIGAKAVKLTEVFGHIIGLDPEVTSK